jgi:hypothetical protein
MKKFLFGLGCMLCSAASAQILKPTVDINLDARVDYQYEDVDGTTIDDNSGFKGKYLDIQVDGELMPGLSYSWRQRLNKSSNNSSFFDATDWINLEYQMDPHWAISGGKQVVAIGGVEYDRSPVDIYRGSEFWNNIPCYQLGGSISYTGNQKRDKLSLQVCTNPFHDIEGSNNNTYAYNLMWVGTHGFLKTYYSANLIEYLPSHYITYLALGHAVHFSKDVTLELDLMNRASSGQTYFFKDASVMANFLVNVSKKVQLFAKGTYDVNHTTSTADYDVTPGTEIKLAGIGVEYHPLRDRWNDVRLHASCFYSWGKNTQVDGTLQDKQTIANVGLTWYMHLTPKR